MLRADPPKRVRPAAGSGARARPARGRALALFALVALAAGLIGGQLARAESGRLRGIGADLRAARELEAQDGAADAAALDRELGELAEQRTHVQLALRARIRALYRITRAGMAPVAGGFEAVRRHVARVKRMSLLVQHDAAALHALEQREQVLRGSETRASADPQAPAAPAGAELSISAARSALPAEPKPHSDKPAEPDAAGSEPERPEASSGSFYGIRFADGDRASSFASQRGRLASPVGGELRVVEARRAESTGTGLELQAPAGSSVRAAAPGRIAFCDRYGSYGQLIIIDHGAGYYTAYGGLGAVDVQVGDDVSALARIGVIGSDQAVPALYFEVRKAEKTLPARQWLGL
jgi:murein hydrolase activator